MEEQRTKNVFEIINGYKKPPLLPQSAFNENDAIKNVNTKFIHRLILKSFFFFSGYGFFKNNVHKNIEATLRTSDFRSGALFAPVVSAALSIKDDPRNISPTERAATLIIAAREFYKDLVSAKLTPDKYKDQILEMGQYPNFFSTTQIIENGKVSLFKSKNTSQITVVVNKKFFLLELGDIDNELTVEQVKTSLDKIVENINSKNTDNEYNSPGVLTCAKNNTQISIFNQLIKIGNNREALNKIKHSFLVLCLDFNLSPETDAEATRLGQIGNYENRWYHTSLQIVVFKNSKVSLICNFSNSIGGNAMMRVGSEIQKRASEVVITGVTVPQKSLSKPVQLDWVIDKSIIKQAEKDVVGIIDKQDSTFEITTIGTNYFDSKNVKAVPAFILALQMTIKKLTEKDIKITQFLTMSKYRCMDLTTTTVTTSEVIKFVKLALEDSKETDELINSFNDAINSQINKLSAGRKTLPIMNLIKFFIGSRKGLSKKYVIILNSITHLLLKLTGFYQMNEREVIVSHPKIYDEVTVLGRPGIKIPYAKYFGLHYQIFNEKIVITMMPGLNWSIPNLKFIKELTSSLEKIKNMLEKYNNKN